MLLITFSLTKKQFIMKLIFPLLLLALHGCNAAPTEAPSKVGFGLDPSQIKGKIETINSAAVQKATQINNLVESNLATIGGLLNEGYSAVTETFKTGYETISETAKSGLNSASGLLNEQVEAVSDVVNKQVAAASEVVNKQVEAASNIVTRQVEAVGSLAKQKMEVVGDLAAQGSALVQTATNGIAHGVQAKSEAVSGLVDQARSLAIGPAKYFKDRPRKIESASLDYEDLGSKKSSVKENLGAFFANIFQPKPIVDGITEEEKYGNTGDKFESVGRVLVTGSESIMGFLSNAINLPFDTFKEITRSASSKLNNLGSRLIGL